MRYPTKFILLGFSLLPNFVHASQSNFQIAPPPIASPEFKDGEEDRKVSVTYAGITGTGFSLNGVGGNLVYRKANSDVQAVDVTAGVFLMGGTIDVSGASSNMTVMSIPLSANFEYQAVKNDSTDVIVFAGPVMNFGLSAFSYSSAYTYISSYTNYYLGNTLLYRVPNYTTVTNKTNVSTTTLLYGGQVGAQASINSGDYTYTPYVMLQSQQGSAATTSTPTYGSGSSSSLDLPNFTSTTFGFDMLYRPMNITLSGMIQAASGGGSNNSGFKATIISLGWKI